MQTVGPLHTLLCDQREGVLRVTLNRPQRLNAFNAAMFRELDRVARWASDNGDVRVVVFTGSGRAFSSGADLRDLVSAEGSGHQERLVDAIRFAQAVFDRVEAIPVPTIAALNGHAVGAGLQLALACDFRIAEKGIKLGLSDVKIGIIPALGATLRLPQLVGMPRAKELILTGELMEADKALDVGLVNEVVEPGQMQPAVDNLCSLLLQRAPQALRAAKELIRDQAQLDRVAEVQASLILSDDAREGIKAFLEKRPPRFRGR